MKRVTLLILLFISQIVMSMQQMATNMEKNTQQVNFADLKDQNKISRYLQNVVLEDDRIRGAVSVTDEKAVEKIVFQSRALLLELNDQLRFIGKEKLTEKEYKNVEEFICMLEKVEAKFLKKEAAQEEQTMQHNQANYITSWRALKATTLVIIGVLQEKMKMINK